MRWCAGPMLPGRVLPDSQSKARIVAWVRRPEDIGANVQFATADYISAWHSFDVTDVTREFASARLKRIWAAEKERARVFGADPLRSKRLLLHSGLDVGNMQSARRLVQIATYLYLLAFELLGFVLVIDLVGSGVSLQNVLVTGFHYCSRVGFSSLGRSRG